MIYDSGPNSHGTGVGDQVADVATGTNGDQVFVTGQVPDANTQAWKAATVAYNSDGGLMWVAHFAGSHGAAPADIEVSSDGSTVFVIGGSANKDRTVFVMTAVAYDSKTGEERWVAEYGSKAGGAALALSPTGDELYVTGPEASGDEGNIDFATAAFSTSTGTLLWAARYDAANDTPSQDLPMFVYSAGNHVYVGGLSTAVRDGRVMRAFVAVAYDKTEVVSLADPAEQDPLWVSRYVANGHSPLSLAWYPPVMRLSPDSSRLFVLLTDISTSTDHDAVVVAYDAVSGYQEWAVTYPRPKEAFRSWGGDLVVSPDGERVYITGATDTYDAGVLPWGIWDATTGLTDSLVTSDIKLLTAAYDSSTGRQLWSSNYRHVGFDEGFAIGVSPDGQHVYVTGRSLRVTPRAWLKYDLYGTFDPIILGFTARDGEREWLARFGADDYKFVEDLHHSVSTDGKRLYVSATQHTRQPEPSYVTFVGQVFDQRIGNVSDYLLVAYDLENE